MIKEAVATGATIEEAQKAAVLALNAPISAEIQFEVLSFPEKKKFGFFGGKLAEVRAFYETGADDKSMEKPFKNVKKQPKEVKREEKKEPAKETVKPEVVQTETREKKNYEPVSVDDCPETVKKAYNYLNTIISGVGISNADVQVLKDDEKEFLFNITSEEDYSILIGRRGETLDSIQYLVRLVANRGKDEENFSKISINIGNYRQRREVTLKEIARKTAFKVKKYGRSIALDPMNPFERRIIHTEISEISDVVSYSVGSDADRKVIIALADGVRSTYQKKPYNDNGRGGYNKNRRGGRFDNRTSENRTVEAPSRAPRSDAEGLSRYGKIQPKDAQ